MSHRNGIFLIWQLQLLNERRELVTTLLIEFDEKKSKKYQFADTRGALINRDRWKN